MSLDSLSSHPADRPRWETLDALEGELRAEEASFHAHDEPQPAHATHILHIYGECEAEGASCWWVRLCDTQLRVLGWRGEGWRADQLAAGLAAFALGRMGPGAGWHLERVPRARKIW